MKRKLAGLAIGFLAAVSSASGDTVWLDEPGVWDRISDGHGIAAVRTDGKGMVKGSYTRGVRVCAPSALYLALNGNALSFEANVGQYGGPNKSKLTFRVYNENRLVFESPVLDRDSGPHKVKADLTGARWVKLELYGLESPYSGYSILGDARFEMKSGTRPQDIATLSRQLGILTPPAAKTPRINGPVLFGARPLSGGSVAVAMVNLSPYEQNVLFCLKKAGMEGTWRVRDLWRQQDEGNATVGYRVSVPGHATHLVRFTPVSGAGLRRGLADVRDNDWFRRVEAFRTLGERNAPCARCD